MTDSKKLRELISANGLKLSFIAEKLGITPYSLQLKIDNKRQFKSEEIQRCCEVLNIKSLEAKEEIFFAV